MALSGVSRLCKNCSEECKQWEQVKVVRCPFYQLKQDAKTEGVHFSSTAKWGIGS